MGESIVDLNFGAIGRLELTRNEMSSKTDELIALDHQVLWHPFTQMADWAPLVIDRGEGNYLFDTEGRRYLDGVSSLWCNVHGH
ncbi:MAG TPA: hypothetical protein VGC41_02385, partial [Kofleriaceae bacterium]